jgi:hypothetical protein
LKAEAVFDFLSAEECDRNDSEQSGRPPDDHVRMECQGPHQDGFAPVPLSRPGENRIVFEKVFANTPANNKGNKIFYTLFAQYVSTLTWVLFRCSFTAELSHIIFFLSWFATDPTLPQVPWIKEDFAPRAVFKRIL